MNIYFIISLIQGNIYVTIATNNVSKLHLLNYKKGEWSSNTYSDLILN